MLLFLLVVYLTLDLAGYDVPYDVPHDASNFKKEELRGGVDAKGWA